MREGEVVNPEQAKAELIRGVRVTTQMVTYAKAYMLKHHAPDVTALITSLLKNVDARKPESIVIHQSVDTSGMISAAANYFSWRLAACEAIWGLISSNCLIPASSDHYDESNYFSWTTVIPGSGGQSSGWHLDQFSLPVPRKVLLKPSGIYEKDAPLSDPDLYLHEMSIDGMGKDIEDSLRESVQCFKHELYLGSLALLGRASEGAWIELGLALARTVPESAAVNGQKLRESMEDQFVGIGKKIAEVLKMYERRDIFGEYYKSSGYKPSDLKSVVVWSDAVRESRNSIHYGAKPAMSNSYEKVAALLIGAVANFRVIYSIIDACDGQA
jgi:hypothetical protein